jgi:hypothetical protein
MAATTGDIFTEVGGSHVGEAPAGATITRIAVAGSEQPRRPTISSREGAGVVPPAPSFFMPANTTVPTFDFAETLTY